MCLHLLIMIKIALILLSLCVRLAVLYFEHFSPSCRSGDMACLLHHIKHMTKQAKYDILHQVVNTFLDLGFFTGWLQIGYRVQMALFLHSYAPSVKTIAEVTVLAAFMLLSMQKWPVLRRKLQNLLLKLKRKLVEKCRVKLDEFKFVIISRDSRNAVIRENIIKVILAQKDSLDISMRSPAMETSVMSQGNRFTFGADAQSNTVVKVCTTANDVVIGHVTSIERLVAPAGYGFKEDGEVYKKHKNSLHADNE